MGEPLLKSSELPLYDPPTWNSLSATIPLQFFELKRNNDSSSKSNLPELNHSAITDNFIIRLLSHSVSTFCL